MATSDYNNPLPTRKRIHTTPDGHTFSYTITELTTNCFLFEADHTHMVKQFASVKALNNWWQELKAHLDMKYSRVGGGGVAHQRTMIQQTGETHPYRAHDVLMAQYLAGK